MLQNDLSPELVDYLADRPSVRVEARPGVNFSYLGFNMEDPVTGRAEVRRAIAHAIDRGQLLRYLFRDRGRTAESLFPPDHWAGTRSCPATPMTRHSPERCSPRPGSVRTGPCG